jgi:hypothetical protein
VLWIAVLADPAAAAEVVWLSPPTAEQQAQVAALAHARGPALTPLELRAAATRWTQADEVALQVLDNALERVRVYEEQLDGELVIVGELEGPIDAVTALRGDSDRARLFAALTYQGFAVDRYWGASFAQASEAAPYRVSVGALQVERPWLDAIALEPQREATPYQIAEAPQRVAYNTLRAQLAAVPGAELVPLDLPPQGKLVVDGRPSAPGPGGTLGVSPGRHFVHIELEGQIIGRVVVRVQPGDQIPLSPHVPETEWNTFLTRLDGSDSGPLPARIAELVDALGGEVWVARPGEPPSVVALAPEGLRAVPLEATPAPEPPDEPEPRAPWKPGLTVGGLGGWLSSGDFYTQDPLRAPHTAGTVNAAALGGWLGADVTRGLARIGLGLDLLVTVGAYHVALTGQDSTRARPVPHLSAGLRWVQLTAGFMFPYHPAVGGRLELSLGPLETHVSSWLGLPLPRTRADGSRWEPLPVYVVAAGAGVRF